MAAAIAFLLAPRIRILTRSPTSRGTVLGLAIALPVLTVSGYVFDLLQGFDRGEFPHWADSMAIPLMGVPFQLGILVAWSLAHLCLLRGIYHPRVPLFLAVSRASNPWLLFVSAITALFVLLSAVSGAYWYAAPGVLWLYLYLSIGASRRVANGT